MHNRLNNGAKVIRSAFGLAQKYRGSGLTRQDFIDDTPQARATTERFGPLPEAILNGKLRSSFSSPPHGRAENPGVTDDE